MVTLNRMEGQLIGGRLSLDFANHLTADGAPADYAELVTWSRQAGSLDAAAARRLQRVARRRGRQADGVHRRALELAAALYRVFRACSESMEPDVGDVGLLNEELGAAMVHGRVVSDGDAFRWDWNDTAPALDRVLWPVARCAADLLVSEELERLKSCDNHRCAWLFLDTSKNRRRRWCDMKVCGNRAKARRYRARQRVSARVAASGSQSTRIDASRSD